MNVVKNKEDSQDIININDQDIAAYIDDELAWEDSKYIQNLLIYDPTSQKKCDDIKNQKKLLKLYWDSLTEKEKSELF